MRNATLRRKCRSLLRSLDAQVPLDVKQLCQGYATLRDRPLHLLCIPIPIPGPFGLWIKTTTADYIAYQQETTPAHQDHIILHELGHIISDHPGEAVGTDLGYPDSLANRENRMDPEDWILGMRRNSYDKGDEREAELIATMILEWAYVQSRLPLTEYGDDRSLRQVESALWGQARWM